MRIHLEIQGGLRGKMSAALELIQPELSEITPLIWWERHRLCGPQRAPPVFPMAILDTLLIHSKNKLKSWIVYFYAKTNPPSYNHSARFTQFKALVLSAPTCLPQPRAPWAASSTLERMETLEVFESSGSLARYPHWMCISFTALCYLVRSQT